jgi:hypothetical protein
MAKQGASAMTTNVLAGKNSTPLFRYGSYLSIVYVSAVMFANFGEHVTYSQFAYKIAGEWNDAISLPWIWLVKWFSTDATTTLDTKTAKGISLIVGAAWLSHGLRGLANAPVTVGGKIVDACALIAFQYAYATLTIAGSMGWKLPWIAYILFLVIIGRASSLLLADFESKFWPSTFSSKHALSNWFGYVFFALAISLVTDRQHGQELHELIILLVLCGKTSHANLRLLAWRSRWVLISLAVLFALNSAALLVERYM